MPFQIRNQFPVMKIESERPVKKNSTTTSRDYSNTVVCVRFNGWLTN